MLKSSREKSAPGRLIVVRASTGRQVLELDNVIWDDNLLLDKKLAPGLYILKYQVSDDQITFKYAVR
jgi:hypothetical protein